MCIPLIGQTISTEDDIAVLELVGGERVQANIALHPDVQAGEYVLVDRGLVIEVIDAEQAESMINFYADLSNLWDEQDALVE